MPRDKKPGISDKERALIEEARRMVGARAATDEKAVAAPIAAPFATPRPAPIPASLPAHTPAKEKAPTPNDAPNSATDKATRIAALMQAERDETARRRRQARRWGIYLPLSITTLAVLWIAITMLR